jgi:hypothetical protein
MISEKYSKGMDQIRLVRKIVRDDSRTVMTNFRGNAADRQCVKTFVRDQIYDDVHYLFSPDLTIRARHTSLPFTVEAHD